MLLTLSVSVNLDAMTSSSSTYQHHKTQNTGRVHRCERTPCRSSSTFWRWRQRGRMEGGWGVAELSRTANRTLQLASLRHQVVQFLRPFDTRASHRGNHARARTQAHRHTGTQTHTHTQYVSRENGTGEGFEYAFDVDGFLFFSPPFVY